MSAARGAYVGYPFRTNVKVCDEELLGGGQARRVVVVGLVYKEPSLGGGFCILNVAPGGGI